jgi:hypothetical protein
MWESFGPATTGGAEADAGPVAIIAPITFDAHGHFSMNLHINLNGAYSATSGVTGT